MSSQGNEYWIEHRPMTSVFSPPAAANQMNTLCAARVYLRIPCVHLAQNGP